MSEKLKEVLSFIDEHHIKDKVTLEDNGNIKIDNKLYSTVIEDVTELDSKELKLLRDTEQKLIAGVTHVASNLAAESFKKDSELNESGFSMKMGTGRSLSGVFNRDADKPTRLVVETNLGSEVKRVISAANDLFKDINS